ncbi:MAG: hypothetical protein C6H99_04135, partial [Epsilonproteobacteria bacterium]|nr:hypothetical protein [Campylobacterota bacterium]NPA64966.1 hypothetical protein [Campylobacterota bacterium]
MSKSMRTIEEEQSLQKDSAKEWLQHYLTLLTRHGGSDLFLKPGAPLCARLNGDVVQISERILTKEDMEYFAREFLKEKFGEFVTNKDIDIAFSIEDVGRFRVNFFQQIDGISAVFRVIPSHIQTI